MDVRGSSQWLSSNEKVVHINRITGEAQARGEGIAEGMQLWLSSMSRIHYLVSFPPDSYFSVWFLHLNSNIQRSKYKTAHNCHRAEGEPDSS